MIMVMIIMLNVCKFCVEILFYRNQKQQGMVLEVPVFVDLGYTMLCHLIQKCPRHLTTSKEKFKDMILIAAVDYVDCIFVI